MLYSAPKLYVPEWTVTLVKGKGRRPSVKHHKVRGHTAAKRLMERLRQAYRKGEALPNVHRGYHSYTVTAS